MNITNILGIDEGRKQLDFPILIRMALMTDEKRNKTRMEGPFESFARPHLANTRERLDMAGYKVFSSQVFSPEILAHGVDKLCWWLAFRGLALGPALSPALG